MERVLSDGLWVWRSTERTAVTPRFLWCFVLHDYHVSEKKLCCWDFCDSDCNNQMHFGEWQVLIIIRQNGYVSYNLEMNTFANEVLCLMIQQQKKLWYKIDIIKHKLIKKASVLALRLRGKAGTHPWWPSQCCFSYSSPSFPKHAF